MAGLGDALMAALSPDPAAYDALLFCGTIPRGVPGDMYARLLGRFRPRFSLLDACQGVDADLLRAAALVKVNRREYASLEPLAGRDGPAVPGHRRGGGGGGDSRRRTLDRIPVASLEKVRNPIGAGDAVSAGTLHFLLEGHPPAEAFRRGLAMGSASCLSLEPAQFAWEDFEALLPRVGPARKGA